MRAEHSTAWHRLQQRLAQDLELPSAEPRTISSPFGVRAGKVCWLLRAHRNAPRGPGDALLAHPRRAA